MMRAAGRLPSLFILGICGYSRKVLSLQKSNLSKMRNTLTSLFMVLAISAMADNLQGFAYGKASAPTGREWQSPTELSLNKEQPRAHMFPFASKQEAIEVLPYGSSFYQTLDGTWKFRWVASPEQRDSAFQQPGHDVSAWDDIQVPGCWNVQGLGKHGEMKYGVPIYVNQPVIFYHQIAVDDWKKGVMRKPTDARWTTNKYPNEVGSYLRTFTVPANWTGRQIFINFDGVDSFFYLWINGHYVGFSKNSRNTARFDISPYLKEGENTVAVEVYRSSDGSFLESQDMFRLPGIFRSTYLTAMSKVQVRDMAVRTKSLTLDKAVITVDQEIINQTSKELKELDVNYTVYPVEMYTDQVQYPVQTATQKIDLKKGDVQQSHLEISVDHPNRWSAEAPNRYVLVAEIKDKKGRTIDCTSTYFGIRTVEIRETKAEDDEFGLAGRYFYVNNMPVKLKGVNRHETNPTVGHAITHKQMEEEVMLMKRGNINHVRLSHYSNDPYWYYLADKYGLYLEDECNIESHQYYYGRESLSHPLEWRPAHIARNMEMVHGHINHPSIVIWSLGNEAGPGENFVAAYNAIKAYDTSRPVQYERNNDIVDMGSNQYPSVSWVQSVAKGKSRVKYPYHISEYAHSMGNSLGNLVDYWDAMESTNFFCGGAIWDWVDQAIDTYTQDGQKYLGYGGDHGDWPNDGMFCMNGIMLPDLSPKPQYYEVKKVYQNAGIKADWENNAVEIFNKNYFTTLRDYQVRWTLIKDGKEEKRGEFVRDRMMHGPRKSKSYKLPFNIKELPADGEYFLNVELTLGRDMPWAKRGYVQMSEQLPCTFNYYEHTNLNAAKGTLKVVRGGTETDIQGEGFHVAFDDVTGSINTMVFQGETLIEPGNGPKIDAFRAPVDNDNWAWNQWFQNGLYDLQHKAQGAPIVVNEKDGSVSVIYTVWSQAKNKGQVKHRPGKAGEPFESIQAGNEMTEKDFHFVTTQRYTIYPNGAVAVNSSIISSDASVVLPRLGYVMKLPASYDKYTYYGRGPLNNYADRKTGSFVGLYESTVKDQFVNFPKPQSMGNREDVRWCALTNGQGSGMQFVALNGTMSTSALPWSALQMTLAAHPHELPQSDGTYLHLDCQVTGLGGNSCGQGGPLDQDRVKGALHQMKFVIQPLNRGAYLPDYAKVECNVACPVSISRDRAGNVTIQGDGNVMDPALICYQITERGAKKPGKVLTYDPNLRMPCIVPMRSGGTITAWYKGDEAVKTSATYERVENVPVEVVYVSSEEGPGGEVAKNLVDGDPGTIWHTMYSITVPKYPHWIDFDCNEVKTIKGFTYLPRQDGGVNGNIKGYKLQLSMDGKTWSDAVVEGEFENNAKEKKVMLPKTQKARYLRFTATSSQNGADYASGSEFGVLAE